MTKELQQRAREFAEGALAEITTFPADYGIDSPWKSVQEWVDFEFRGAAADEFHSEEEIAASEAAMREVATLEALNAPFITEE
jgi:hypothetical protein